MREIKYQAYIPKLNRCLPVFRIEQRYETIITDEGEKSLLPTILEAWVQDEDGDTFQVMFSADRPFLRQSTGLNDKNGIEIYEGDVVRVWSKLWKVDFGTGSFNIYALTGTSSEPLYETFANDDYDLEVVGHIYQTKFLKGDLT